LHISEYLHDTIGRFVRLTKQGNGYIAICPFHDESTPSFTVNPKTNVYHCFGCDAHGHADDFESAFKAIR
jgi:DNA primase